MTTKMLDLHFTLQSQELIALFRRKQFQTTRWRWVLLGVMMILVAWFCSQIVGWGGLLMFVVIFSMLLIWLLWGYPRLVLRTMKKMPSWGKPVQYVFDDNGFTQQTAVLKATVQWHAIIRVEELPDWFLLHIGSPLIFYAIPKRAFTVEQQQALKTLLKNKGLLKV